MPPASLDVGPDGSVGVIWTSAHEADDRNVYFAESTDDGASYGTNYRVHQVVTNTQKEPAITYDAFGVIHVCWQTQIESWDYDIQYAFSDNHGVTFSEPERVNDDPPGSMHAQAEVDIIDDPAGGLLAIWMDPRQAFDENVFFASSAAAMGIDNGWENDLSAGDGSDNAPLASNPVHIFPNPMRTGTWLRARAATLYDVRGRLVRHLRGGGESGRRLIHWDGRDLRGRPVAPGAYFVRLETERGPETRRVIVTP